MTDKEKLYDKNNDGRLDTYERQAFENDKYKGNISGSKSPSASKQGESEQERQQEEKRKAEAKKKAESIPVRGTGYSAHGAMTQKAIAVADPTAQNIQNAKNVAVQNRPTVTKADRDLNAQDDGIIEEIKPGTPIKKNLPTESFGNNEELQKMYRNEQLKLSEMSPEQAEALEQRVRDTTERMKSFIDPSFIENIPKSLWRSAKEGDFGKVYVDKDIKKKRNEIKKKPESEWTDEEKKIVAEYDKQVEETKPGKSRFINFIINNIATGLSNTAQIFKGGTPSNVSDWEKVKSSKLAGALERYNKKYKDIADTDSQLIASDAVNRQEIQNQLEKIYADKAVQPYITRMDLNTRKIFVDYVSRMGKNIDIRDIPGLLAGLLVYQDTGNLSQNTMNMLGMIRK